MILLLAVAGGLLAGFVRVAVGKRQFAFPDLKLGWLVPVAFVPQLLTFYLPATQNFMACHLGGNGGWLVRCYFC